MLPETFGIRFLLGIENKLFISALQDFSNCRSFTFHIIALSKQERSYQNALICAFW